MNGVLYPITPSKITMKIGNKNKTINLINEGEVNLLKSVGLTSYEFDLLLPNAKYPFARYENDFEPAKYFLDKLFDLKTNKKPFQFIVVRSNVNKVFFNTDVTVSLEDLNIKEDVNNGFDIVVTIKLKDYKEFGTKVYDATKTNNATEKRTDSDNKPKLPTTYTVKSGDTLCKIAKYFYGDSSLYCSIVTANNIKNPNLIITGAKLQIPATGSKYTKSTTTTSNEEKNVEYPPYTVTSRSGIIKVFQTKIEAVGYWIKNGGMNKNWSIHDRLGKKVV
jgi:LysM repeat protein